MNVRPANTARRAEVERIVRQVLAEIGGGQRAGQSPSSHGELVLAAKVVSAKQLEGRLAGVTRVIVPRGAVVTPAARDLLRERQIAIASAVETLGNHAPSTGHRVVLAVADVAYRAEPLVALLASEGSAAERLPGGGWIDVIDKLCQKVAEGERIGLIVTSKPAEAACLANRHRGVRAALATDAAAVAAATAGLDANVLVADPAGKTSFEWKRIVQAWLHGRRACPPELKQRLD